MTLFGPGPAAVPANATTTGTAAGGTTAPAISGTALLIGAAVIVLWMYGRRK
jgi:hypothetical protein